MFSWSSSGPKSSASSNDARRGRSKADHLSSYLEDRTLKPSTRKVSNDDSTYDTVFQTKNANALIVRVHFTDVNQRPKMTLVGIRARHPWLDHKNRIIGYPVIQSDAAWTSADITLGKAVNTVVHHLQMNPPEVLEIVDQSLVKIQERISSSLTGQDQSQQQQSPPPPPIIESDVPPHFNDVLKMEGNDLATQEAMLANVSTPPIPTSFPEFDTMSRSELNELLQNDQKLLSTMEQNFFVAEMESTKQSIIEQSSKSAQINIEMEDKLKASFTEVKNLQDSLKEKVETFNKLYEKQTELCTPEDQKKTIKKLVKAKKEAFNESEDIAASWLNEDLEIEEFLNSFIEKRTVHHVRAAKIERLENS